LDSDGNKSAARIPMMLMTTSNSTNVNPPRLSPGIFIDPNAENTANGGLFRPNAELRHSRRGQRDDEAKEQRISQRR